MGTSPQPLVIGVYGLDMTHPVLRRLSEQGHTIMAITPPPTLACCEPAADLDLIIGPKCWRTQPDLKYLDVSLKVARKVKYGKQLVKPK